MQVGTHIAPNSFKDLGAFQSPHQPLHQAQMVLVPPYSNFPLKPLSQHSREEEGAESQGQGWPSNHRPWVGMRSQHALGPVHCSRQVGGGGGGF